MKKLLYEYKIARDVFTKEQKNLSEKPFWATVNGNRNGLSLDLMYKKKGKVILFYFIC